MPTALKPTQLTHTAKYSLKPEALLVVFSCVDTSHDTPLPHHQHHICWPDIPNLSLSAPLTFQPYFPTSPHPDLPSLCKIWPFLCPGLVLTLDSRLCNAHVHTLPILRLIVNFSEQFDSFSYNALILFSMLSTLLPPCLQNHIFCLVAVLPISHSH